MNDRVGNAAAHPQFSLAYRAFGDQGFCWERFDNKKTLSGYWHTLTLYLMALGSRICESFGGICHPVETWRTIDRGWQINIWLSCVASGLTSFAVFS